MTTPAIMESLIQNGGFAVLAGVALWSIQRIVGIGLVNIEKSHLREAESVKLVIESMRLIAEDRRQMLDRVTEFMNRLADNQDEMREILRSIQDEIGLLREQEMRREERKQ